MTLMREKKEQVYEKRETEIINTIYHLSRKKREKTVLLQQGKRECWNKKEEKKREKKYGVFCLVPPPERLVDQLTPHWWVYRS